MCFSADPVGTTTPSSPSGTSPSYTTSSPPLSAFAVRLGDYNPSSDRILRFRQVIYNRQNHYNTKTGLFTCVNLGLYKFHFSCPSYSWAGNVELWHNDKLVLRGYRVYQGRYFLSSGETVLQLQAGDKVWLEATGGNSGLSTKSFFSGRQLSSDW